MGPVHLYVHPHVVLGIDLASIMVEGEEGCWCTSGQDSSLKANASSLTAVGEESYN